jgi:hypothetical protein
VVIAPTVFSTYRAPENPIDTVAAPPAGGRAAEFAVINATGTAGLVNVTRIVPSPLVNDPAVKARLAGGILTGAASSALWIFVKSVLFVADQWIGAVVFAPSVKVNVPVLLGAPLIVIACTAKFGGFGGDEGTVTTCAVGKLRF